MKFVEISFITFSNSTKSSSISVPLAPPIFSLTYCREVVWEFNTKHLKLEWIWNKYDVMRIRNISGNM